MVCPNCGSDDNPGDALYCGNCAEPLVPDAVPAGASPVISDLPPVAQERPDPATVALDPLAGLAPTIRLNPMDVPWTCASCGRANAAGEGFCDGCGEERPAVLAPLRPGDSFAGWRVVDVLDDGGFAVTPESAAAAAGGAAVLRFGAADTLAEQREVIEALTAGCEGYDPYPRLPRLLASGQDADRGAFLVLAPPAGDWTALDQAWPLSPRAAAAVLAALLPATEAAAAAGRVLLLSPATVKLGGEDHAETCLDAPAAPALPLAGPLRADPAYLAPELRPDRTGAIDPFRAGAFGAAAVLHAVTGSALGFPPGWHTALAALRSEHPAGRPASAAEALALLADGAGAGAGTAHKAAFLTDIGRHHAVNQDAGGVWTWQHENGTPVTLAVVCDGVSAGEHSEDAAALAVELLHEAFAAHWSAAELSLDTAHELLRASALEAHRQICLLPASSYERASATTLVAACVLGTDLTGIWCGDSRAYGLTADGCVALTKDHSWVNLMVDGGRMTPEQARTDPRAHVIARWLGASDEPHADPGIERFQGQLAAGDRLLLCSDGLYMYFEPPADEPARLAQIVLAHGDAVEAAVEDLVHTALDRGGFDNISVALVEIAPVPPLGAAP